MRTKNLLLAVLLAGAACLAGCGGISATGQLGQLQKIATTCPHGEQIAGLAEIDESATGRGNAQLTAARLDQVKALAMQVAACGGHFQAIAFSSSEAAVQTLFDGDLQPSGSEENARLLKVPALITTAMRTVTAALPRATARLPKDGTDDLGAIDLAADYQQQWPRDQLWVDFLTDGISTTGEVITNTPDFTSTVAMNLGDHVAVPRLAGAHVMFSGIGIVATGSPAPTSYVQALTDFYKAVCARTQAATCTVVTDPSEG